MSKIEVMRFIKNSLFLAVFLFQTAIFAYPDKSKYCEYTDSENEKSLIPSEFLLSMALSHQADANHALMRGGNAKPADLHKKAIAAFSQYITCMKAKEQALNPSSYFLKAMSHFEIREFEESLAELNNALSIDSKYRDAFILKTRILIKQNKLKEASTLLESIVEFYSEDSDILYLLGSLNAEEGNYPKAILYLSSLLNNIQKKEGDQRYKSYTLKYLGDIHYKKNDYHKSLYYYKSYLKIKENDIDALFTVAQTYNNIGEFNESRNYLQKILKLSPENRSVIALLAEMHFIENKMFSQNYFQELYNQGKIKEDSLLGYIYKVLNGKHKEVEEYFTAIESKNPNRLSVKIALIIIYSKQKKNQELAAELKSTYELAYTYKQYNLAIEMAVQLLDLLAANPDIKPNPSTGTINDFISTCYEENGAPFLAIHYVRKAIELSATDSEKVNFNTHLASIYRNHKVKRFEESNRILLEMQDKNNPNVFFLIGLNYFSLDKYKESVNYISKAIDLDPKNSVFYFFRANSFDKGKMFKETVNDLKKSIDLDPNYAASYNYLGYLYTENNMELDEAYTIIRKAVDIEPDNVAYQDSLGWVLFKMQKWKESLHHLNLALQLMLDKKEDDPVVYDHLGDVFYKMNDILNANDHWKKSLDLQTNPVEKEKILQKLKRSNSGKTSRLYNRNQE